MSRYLNTGTVPTVCYIFFHFIIGYEKKPAELQLFKKNMVVIVFQNVKIKYSRQAANNQDNGVCN
jgi:ABC-type anion transport system duplicated permease subunit